MDYFCFLLVWMTVLCWMHCCCCCCFCCCGIRYGASAPPVNLDQRHQRLQGSPPSLTSPNPASCTGECCFKGDRLWAPPTNISIQPAVFEHSSIYGQMGVDSGGNNAGPGTAGVMTQADGAASTVSSIAVRQQTRNIQEQRRTNINLISSPHDPSLCL